MAKYRKIIIIILSSLMLSVATKLFIQNYSLYSGGFGGFAIIVSRFFSNFFENSKQFEAYGFSILNILFNFPIFYLGYKSVGKKFTLYSIISVTFYSIMVAILPYNLLDYVGLAGFDDLLVVSIISGLLYGFGISLAFKNGFSFGGLDILSFYYYKKKEKNIGTFMFNFNIFIFILAALVFKDTIALIYTSIYMFVQSLMINILYTKDKRVLLKIITNKPDQIAEECRIISGHTSTIMSVYGSYSKIEKKQINIVITRYDLNKILNKVKQIDENSFIIVQDVRNTIGKFYVRPID